VIILDTNVVSEMMRREAAVPVRAWLQTQDVRQLWLSAITVAELYYGAQVLPEGRRKEGLLQQIDRTIAEDFGDRVADFSMEAAIAFAEIAAVRRRLGRPILPLDCQIAAIARRYGATLATRNISDFEDCGIDLIDPWAA
jgi:predicted nucleic acid-binding protein